jgi:hypothetical protein
MERSMTETSTAAKSPADELREAEAVLARAEQEVTKAAQVVREKRVNVMRVQAKGMGSVLQDAHINQTLANLELSDAEAGETRATQRAAKARQNVDHCQRRFAAALRESRTINANQVA